VAQEEDSMALEADALHLKTDVYTSLGVAIGLVLIKLTGLPVLDPIVAILVALLIIKEAWCLCKDAFDYLLDTKLTDEEEAQIIEVIEQHCHTFKDFHKLKTRKSGNMIHVDFHITVNHDMTAAEIHEIIGCIKKAMQEKFGNTRVSIHTDPFNEKEAENEAYVSKENASQA
jgi:cation diffusion facilitator family transporter